MLAAIIATRNVLPPPPPLPVLVPLPFSRRMTTSAIVFTSIWVAKGTINLLTDYGTIKQVKIIRLQLESNYRQLRGQQARNGVPTLQSLVDQAASIIARLNVFVQDVEMTPMNVVALLNLQTIAANALLSVNVVKNEPWRN